MAITRGVALVTSAEVAALTHEDGLSRLDGDTPASGATLANALITATDHLIILLETRVALDGARRLLDEDGDAIGKRIPALSLLALASTLANHPSNHVANLFCHGPQSIDLSCERILRSHHLEQKTDVNVFLLQTSADP